MDHIPHSFSDQSQTTHHQPQLHRRSWPSALRTQGRLPRRILRRRSPHRPSANLRGYLRPFAGRRVFRPAQHVTLAGNSTAKPNTSTSAFRHQPAPNSQTPTIRTQPQHNPWIALSVRMPAAPWKTDASALRCGLVLRPRMAQRLQLQDRRPRSTMPAAPWKSGASAPRCATPMSPGFSPWNTTGNPKELPIVNICECQMNPPCGKPIRHPRTKPVIVGDTIGSVSLLTGTISGSNFAIP
jgi:hypothetical protein